MIYTFIIRNYY